MFFFLGGERIGGDLNQKRNYKTFSFLCFVFFVGGGGKQWIILSFLWGV